MCELNIRPYGGIGYVSNNSTDFIEQSSETDTQCRDACLGPKGDGILPSGQSCHGCQFKNGKCRLAIAILDIKIDTHQSDGFVTYFLDHRCFSANVPSKCSFTSRSPRVSNMFIF